MLRALRVDSICNYRFLPRIPNVSPFIVIKTSILVFEIDLIS